MTECERCNATENIGWANEDGAFKLCIQGFGCMKGMPEEIWVSELLATNKLGIQMCSIKRTKKTRVPYRLKSPVDARRAADSKTVAALADALETYFMYINGFGTVAPDALMKKALYDNKERIAEAQEAIK